ncbi:MucR family transcriptional regulator [Methylobacterium sp. WSM2598]|uniref:MucR family transcriptional regulator n=1 Tax=Methylobacterium sp. WSM2598 TaxID=398261 RepID=UPI0003820701|nr:MucR family transcriptional regulator [Methylobacterium sp. WSM2598]
MAEDQGGVQAANAISIDIVTDIVSAYLSNNPVRPGDLPALIASVHAALDSLGKPAESPAQDHRVSPAEIRKSITPDHLTSFIDGKPYKALKRHLTKHGISPAEYCTKFGLPADYPMVAPNYAAQRSELAKSIGLGERRRKAVAEKRAAADAKVTEP